MIVTIALTLCGVAAAQACLQDDGSGSRSAPLAWGTAPCVEGSVASERPELWYLLTIPSDARRFELSASASTGDTLDLCLVIPLGEQCRSGEGAASLPDLVLPGGTYAVRFRARTPVGGTYRVDLRDVSEARVGFEREPNDGVDTATPLGPDLAMRGRLEGREQDYFRLDVIGEPRFWRVIADGEGLHALRFHDASGRTHQERRPARDEAGIRMSNLHLLPGPHFFSVDGTDADYALRLEPLASSGALPGRMEREPNDDPSRAHQLRPGEPWVGLLAEAGDRDTYRFFLGQEGRHRVSVTPPADGEIEVGLPDRFTSLGVGVPFVYEGWFLAGDHVVTLRPVSPSEGTYQVLLERLDPFALPDDLEPNDEAYQARPLPIDHEVSGSVGTHGDPDRFLLPAVPVETALRIELTGDDVRLDRLRDPGATRSLEVTLDRESGAYDATVPPGEPWVISVLGSGAYHLRVAFDPGPLPAPRPEAPSVTLSVHAERDRVAAYHYLGQRLQLRVDLRNDGSEAQTLDLETHVSDHGWRAELDEARVTLAAGESRSVGLGITVMPVARDDLSVRVSVGARGDGGGVVSGSIELAAVCGAPAVDPRSVWPLPDRLLGGLNVAWMGLGSEPLTERRREFLIYDGFTPPGDSFNAGLGGATTVRLAGDDAPRVLGVLLHPLGAGTAGEKLADFRVSTSMDGVTFVPAHQGRSTSVASEQAFVFDEAVPARFVRLELLSRQDGALRGDVLLGQFKVIAEPASRPFAAAIDLARRAVGGYVPRSSPHLPLYALTDEPGTRPTTSRLDHGQEEAVFVLGFHHDRAARIDALEWQPHPGSDPESRFSHVEVAISTGDALGPFETIGTWEPHARPVWRFDAPVWARFVRFTATGLEPRSTVEYPAAVRVLEHPVGPEYRSILGEWGHYARDAAFEWRHPPRVRAEAPAEPAHTSRADAWVLVDGDEAIGRVLVGEYDAWFRFDVSATDNHMRIELGGDPTIAYAYDLLDELGMAVDADASVGSDLVTIEAFVSPGSYYLRAWEPPRSVIFAWDNSGSMGPYIDATYQTVIGFASDVSPEREQVQLLAFENPPEFVMPDWTGDPTTLLTELRAYDRSASSSDAETSFAFAIEQMADREGTKAILFVTDAESGASPVATQTLWKGLESVRPRVFTFETSTSGSDDTQDRMQSWSVGGFYDYSRTIGDLEIGFARVSCLLRQPKAVAVALRTESVAPPGPGTLSVRRQAEGESDDGSAPALAIIFDASGSMGKLLPDGSASRLVAARDVLTEIVERVVEPGTPFVLRAYGHVQPTSCDTRLELPLGPLDRATARRAIAGIDAKLLSGTPLARSIALVADDLAGAIGPKTVVLITDGEESCGGDPEAEIRALMDRGIDVELSIISFDLDAQDRAAAAARFHAWAEIGGGRAFEAGNAHELRGALQEALVRRVAFEVLDASGTVVAVGVLDGDPITLPTGAYRVRVDATPEAVFDGVRIRPEARTTVILHE